MMSDSTPGAQLRLKEHQPLPEIPEPSTCSERKPPCAKVAPIAPAQLAPSTDFGKSTFLHSRIPIASRPGPIKLKSSGAGEESEKDPPSATLPTPLSESPSTPAQVIPCVNDHTRVALADTGLGSSVAAKRPRLASACSEDEGTGEDELLDEDSELPTPSPSLLPSLEAGKFDFSKRCFCSSSHPIEECPSMFKFQLRGLSIYERIRIVKKRWEFLHSKREKLRDQLSQLMGTMSALANEQYQIQMKRIREEQQQHRQEAMRYNIHGYSPYPPAHPPWQVDFTPSMSHVNAMNAMGPPSRPMYQQYHAPAFHGPQQGVFAMHTSMAGSPFYYQHPQPHGMPQHLHPQFQAAQDAYGGPVKSFHSSQPFQQPQPYHSSPSSQEYAAVGWPTPHHFS